MAHASPRLVQFAILVWLVATLLVGSVLTAQHQPLRPPAAASTAGWIPGPAGWRAIHVLDAQCGCSRQVLEYLARRPRLDGATEQVILFHAGEVPTMVGDLRTRGMSVVSATDLPAAAAGAFRAVPSFLVAAPDGEIRYSGGYGRRTGEYSDRELWQRVSQGQRPRSLPLYGCAISASLKQQLDPFGWKSPLLTETR